MKKLTTILLVAFLAISTNIAFSQARLQVIHNSADINADTVDIWLDNTLLLDNFAFRNASPFIDAPSDTDFDVVIQPKNSMDTINPVAKFTFNLMMGKTYVVVASGIIDDMKYQSTNYFDLHVFDMGREEASTMGNTDVLVFHGSTDAPTVDIYEVKQSISEVKDGLMYGEFAGYLELPTLDYSLQVRNDAGTDVVAQYGAPLSSLGLLDSAIVVVASGFLDPSMNNNGPAFGLYVALPEGGELIPLPSETISTARLQVIHNSGDALADSVDIYVNGARLLDNFAYRTATPFINVPAGVELMVNIAPKNSIDSSNAVARFNYNLVGNKKYILVANGLLDNMNYSPFKPFNLEVYDMAREQADSSDKIDLNIFHGSTDAPMIDIYESNLLNATIADDFDFGDFTGYAELMVGDYTIELRDNTGMDILLSYMAPLSKLNVEGHAFVAVASGFLTPANNNDGAPFGLFLVPATGGEFIPLDKTASLGDHITIDWNIYPNPTSGDIFVEIDNDIDDVVQISVFDIMGKEVMSFPYTVSDGDNTILVDLSALKSGNYILNIANEKGIFSKTIQVL